MQRSSASRHVNSCGKVCVASARPAIAPLKIELPPDVEAVLHSDRRVGVCVLVPRGAMIDASMQLQQHLSLVQRCMPVIMSATKLCIDPRQNIHSANVAIVAFASALYTRERVTQMLKGLAATRIVFWVCDELPKDDLAEEMTHRVEIAGPVVGPKWPLVIPESAFKIESKWTPDMASTESGVNKEEWTDVFYAATQLVPMDSVTGERRITDALGNKYHVHVGARCLLYDVAENLRDQGCSMMPAVVIGVGAFSVVVYTVLGSILRLSPHQYTRQFALVMTSHVPRSSLSVCNYNRVPGFVFF